MRRTFVDAGVLIAAARGTHELAEMALGILADPGREFVSSDFLRLEVTPKAIYHGRGAETDFYERFFRGVIYWATDFEEIIKDAQAKASTFGLGAMDALHVAAAEYAGASELVTTEKPTKPIHRVTGVSVVCLYP